MVTISSFRTILLAIIFSVIGCIGFAYSTFAATSVSNVPEIKLKGFAWSSNIGWISLSCENDNNCANTTYGVVINPNRQVTGFAWSSNIGWIKFDGLSAQSTDFPSGGGTVSRSAYATGTLPNLQLIGWARACAGTEGGDCSSTAVNSKSGGWDGWISLSGTTHSVKLNATTGIPNSASWAWGSDVVGWIDMHSRVSYSTTTGTGTPSLFGTGCTILVGQSTCTGTTTSWFIPDQYTHPHIFNVTSGVDIATGASGNDVPVPNIGHGDTIIHAKDGSSELSPVTAITLSATCLGATPSNPDANWNGSACTAALPGTSMLPTVSVSIVPTAVRMNDTATVTVTVSPIPSNATYTGSCKVVGGGIANGTITSPDVSKHVFHTTGLTSRTIIRVTCTDDVANVPPYSFAPVTNYINVIPVVHE